MSGLAAVLKRSVATPFAGTAPPRRTRRATTNQTLTPEMLPVADIRANGVFLFAT